MSNVIPLHRSRSAKAQAVFEQIEIAALQKGFSSSMALAAAQAAKRRFLSGRDSNGRVISEERRALRRERFEALPHLT